MNDAANPGHHTGAQVRAWLAIVLAITGVGGTGYGMVSRDEAESASRASEHYEALMLECQHREADRMWDMIRTRDR